MFGYEFVVIMFDVYVDFFDDDFSVVLVNFEIVVCE